MADLFDDRPTIQQFKNTYRDWRLPENRIEAFTRIYHTRMAEGDLDHWLTGKLIADYMKLSDEQRAWYCVLFGFSYKNHWPMFVLQTFPEIWKTSVEEITRWYNDHDGKENGVWRRTFFSKDCKWNVRKFPQFVESVQQWLGSDSLYDRIHEIGTSGKTTAENFDKLNSALIDNLHGIGRMTSWLTMQTIFEFFNLDIDKWDLQLADAGCWSQYEALCFTFDREDIFSAKTPETVKLMEKNVQTLMGYVESQLAYTPDIYNIESCLCNFRKAAMKTAHTKDFTFHASHELRENFATMYKAWEESENKIDWAPLVLGITQRGPGASRVGGDMKIYNTVMSETGLNFNTHYQYADEPDAYELLAIPKPEDCEQPLELLAELARIDPAVVKHYKEKFDPLKHLRWKKP